MSFGLVHNLMHLSITSSCKGHICFSSSSSRALVACNVLDWLMSIHTGDAYRCHRSTGNVSFVFVTGSLFYSLDGDVIFRPISPDKPYNIKFADVKESIEKMADEQSKTDTICFDVTSKEGRFTGNGISYYQYTVPVCREHYMDKDSIHITIRHAMKRDILPGISDIGVKLERIY